MQTAIDMNRERLLPMIPHSVRVVSRPHIFSHEIIEFYVPAGTPLSSIIERVGIRRGRAVAQVDGVPIPESAHSWYVPPPESLVVVRAAPGPWMIPIVVAVALTVAEVGAVVFAVAMAAATIASVLLTNALAKPAQQPSLSLRTPEIPLIGVKQRGSRAGITQSPSLSGGRNQSNRYGPIPRVLGRHKIIPPYGADPYTEIYGWDQYLRLCFVLGYGPLDVSDLKIGDTPIGNFTDVDYEVREGYSDDEPLTLFTSDIEEESLNIHLTSAGGWYTRTTSRDTDEITIDITFPSGLVRLKSSYEEGEDPEDFLTVHVQCAYSVAGADSWTYINIQTQSKRGITIRKSVRISGIESGRYDVRVRRVTEDTESTLLVDDVYWTALRSIHNTNPVTMTGLAMVALRIKANDQLNGTVDTFNCVCQSVVRDWDSATGTWIERATSNPASLYREVLQGSANKRALDDAEVDLDGLQDWHEFCEAEGFEYNQPVDYQTSVEDVLNEIAAAGRASMSYVDGKYGVVWDREQTTPVQHFTPRNSWGFSAEKAFIDMPHAFRILFANAAKDWQEDELIVYDDGYDFATATRFEKLELPGVTGADLAWKHGRYFLAVARLRPEIYSWNADVEHIVCTKGDLVRMTHDVPMWGVGFGRVKSLTDNGTHVTAVTMDESLAMDDSTDYCIRFRKTDGTTLLCNVEGGSGYQATLTLSAPVLIAQGPAVGDLGLFGVRGSESVELIIRSVEPTGGLNARITAWDCSPAIYGADTGAIPEFNSQITAQDVIATIGAPIVERIDSGESVLERATDGTFVPRVLIVFKYVRGRLFDQIVETQVEYRPSGSDGTWERELFPGYAPQVYLWSVTEGRVYDIRARYRISDGRVSDWTFVFAHTVIGKTSPPPDVERLWSDGVFLRWEYPTPPADFAGFRVKHKEGVNTNWDGAVAISHDLVAGTVFPLAAFPGGTRTILVKAVDVAGNESADPAILVKDLGDPDLANVVTTEDYAAAGFVSTVVGSIGYQACRLDITAGNAFAWLDGIDMQQYQSGDWQLTITDSAGKSITGWIKSGAPAGETLDAELVSNGDFATNDFTGWNTTDTGGDGTWDASTGTAQLTAGVTNTNFNDGIDQTISLTLGGVYRISAELAKNSFVQFAQAFIYKFGVVVVYLAVDTSANLTGTLTARTEYYTCESGGAGWVLYFRPRYGLGGVLSVDNVSVKRVLDPPAQGAHIVSAKGGATREWTSEDAGFDRYDANGYTYRIANDAMQFMGVVENGLVDGTELEADTAALFWTGDDNALFWHEDADTFWTADYLQMTYICGFEPDAGDLPAQMTLEYDIDGNGVQVLYSETGVELFWSEDPDTAMWSGTDADLFWTEDPGYYVPWPGSLQVTAAATYYFKIITEAGPVQGVIHDFAVSLDVNDIEETLDDVTIDELGTRLPVTETYRTITNVQITVQDDGGSGVFARIIDKDTSGPLIEVYTIAGAACDGTVDARVKGY